MFDLKKPCSNCPFRKVGGIRLRADRVREIARSQTDIRGAVFYCHKTTTHEDDDEDDGYVPKGREQYCAGAIAFAVNVGSLNQMLRIAERTGVNLEAIGDRDQVFDSVAAMLKAQKKR